MMDREGFVAEARSWIGTPYILGQGTKKAGVDCARFVAECLINCGLSGKEDLGFYSHDWYHHTSSERYLIGLVRHAKKTLEGIAYKSLSIRPGTIAAIKAAGSRVINHAGIVTAWPFLVHANISGVQEVDASRHPMWHLARIEIFDPFES